MASKKGSKEVVKLENKETGYFYTTTKNTKSENTAGKIKYDPTSTGAVLDTPILFVNSYVFGKVLVPFFMYLAKFAIILLYSFWILSRLSKERFESILP